jgi:hypothetical protein
MFQKCANRDKLTAKIGQDSSRKIRDCFLRRNDILFGRELWLIGRSRLFFTNALNTPFYFS